MAWSSDCEGQVIAESAASARVETPPLASPRENAVVASGIGPKYDVGEAATIPTGSELHACFSWIQVSLAGFDAFAGCIQSCGVTGGVFCGEGAAGSRRPMIESKRPCSGERFGSRMILRNYSRTRGRLVEKSKSRRNREHGLPRPLKPSFNRDFRSVRGETVFPAYAKPRKSRHLGTTQTVSESSGVV